MKRVVEGYFRLLKLMIVLCLAAMVILVFGNVVLRYGFNSGITVSEELSRMFFVWMTFLGAIIGLREYAHLGVDTLVRKLPAAGKKACLLVNYLLMLFVTYLMLAGSWTQTVINIGVQAPASGLSMGLFYGVGVVFSLSTGAILLHEIYRILAGKLAEHELIMVVESEEQAELDELQKGLGGHAPPAVATPAHKS
ncbi:MAG TPA: TRAP transporter small permease [Azospirillum sp.]|nr:TRAP transporter small permease [Azospirillum sp.]